MSKEIHLFDLSLEYKKFLKDGKVDVLLKEPFWNGRQTLFSKAKITKTDEKNWEINEGVKKYRIEITDTQLEIYKVINTKHYCCERCGHTWLPRKVEIPKRCPICKSELWNRELNRGYEKSTVKEEHPVFEGYKRVDIRINVLEQLETPYSVSIERLIEKSRKYDEIVVSEKQKDKPKISNSW